jgi:glycine C-acetyltransferase/8-amino-7-oxononanoate synthase
LGAGSGASRLISGNLLIHEKLEKKIALFKREESSLVFSSGYMANLGVITSLAGENDVIFLDRLNHASLIDAAKLSRAKLWVYPHKDVGRLEVLLKRAAVFRRRLVITDAYFSMDGDVAPLDGLLDVCEKSDSILMIDEAHSTGVFGRTGRGMTEHFGLEARIPVVMGTLSKALGSSGGFVAGKNLLRETLINRAREFIYTTAPVPAASAAAMASLEWIEKNPAQLKKFWRLIQKTRDSLKGAGFDLMGSEGPVIPVVIKNSEKTLRIRDFLKKQGVFVPAIRPPTVPKNTDRLRISLKATHTDEQIDRLIQALVKARKKFL